MPIPKKIILFAKSPALGNVKTRIADEAGEDRALKIYKQLLLRTISTVDKLGLDIRKIVAWSEDGSFLQMSENWHVWVQPEGSLGDRMDWAARKAFLEGSSKAVIIGSDCPDLQTTDINRAFDTLERTQVVIGPARDGGYYLLGMNQYVPQVFNDIKWGAGEVLDRTLDNLLNANISYHLIEEKTDIDKWSDWKEWQQTKKPKQPRGNLMDTYYNPHDLSKFADISKGNPELWEKFLSWYSSVFQEGELTVREKILIALGVAHAIQCPYCIDAYTQEGLSNGCSDQEMTEAVHVAAAIRGGASLVHGVQYRNTVEKLSM